VSVNNISIASLIGKVCRHNRLFNYVVSPISFNDDSVKCQTGGSSYKDFPLDYFMRDWHIDDNINFDDLLDKTTKYPVNTPFTTIYDAEYEIDDGLAHAYIHFNDDMSEKMVRFPLWRLTTCKKSSRDELINPFTMIMPVTDGLEIEIQHDLNIINDIRKENEFIKIDDFQGFEFGLIKYLERKYLRLV